MAYNLAAGDKVEIEYKNENGELKETRGTVEVNYDNVDQAPWTSSTGIKIKRGTGRTAHLIRLNNDGTLRCSPYYNANGRGEDGHIVSMSLVDEPEDIRRERGLEL